MYGTRVEGVHLQGPHRQMAHSCLHPTVPRPDRVSNADPLIQPPLPPTHTLSLTHRHRLTHYPHGTCLCPHARAHMCSLQAPWPTQRHARTHTRTLSVCHSLVTRPYSYFYYPCAHHTCTRPALRQEQRCKSVHRAARTHSSAQASKNASK
jgi:hypothetical protein